MKLKTILVDAINGLVLENGTIFKEMLEMLDAFPNTKIVLTGANDEEFKQFNLGNVPYKVFTLKHDPDKTDPMYYKALLDKYGLTSDEVIYFEHNPEAVKSAESVGIKTFFYDSSKRDVETLKQFLTENI